MNRALRRRLCDPVDGMHVQEVLVDLVDKGLKWNALGMDLTAISGLTEAERESKIGLVHELYLSHNSHGDLHWEPVNPILCTLT